MSFGIPFFDQVAEFCVNAVRSVVATKLKKSNSAVVLKVRDTVQPELEELKEKVESFVHAHLKTAVQSVEQALLIIISQGVLIRNDSAVQNPPILRVEIPIAAKNLLEIAQHDASLVFYDKRNSSPVDRIEALWLQLYCTLKLRHDDPQTCLDTVGLLIDKIVEDVVLKSAVKNKKTKIPFMGNKDVVHAMKKFYIEVRHILWSLSSIWSGVADFSSVIAKFNKIFLRNEAFFNEAPISDGIVFVDVKQRRRVLATNWKQAENEDNLLTIIMKNLSPNSTFQSGFSVTSSKFEDFKVTFDTNVDCHVEYRYSKGTKLGAKSINLEVRFEGRSHPVVTEKLELIKYINKPAYIKYCKIVRVYRLEGKSEKIFVDIEAQSHSKQVVFTVRCNQSGKLKFKGIRCHFNMLNDHAVIWSNKFQRYDVIESVEGDSTKVAAVYCLDTTENKVYDKYDLDSELRANETRQANVVGQIDRKLAIQIEWLSSYLLVHSSFNTDDDIYWKQVMQMRCTTRENRFIHGNTII